MQIESTYLAQLDDLVFDVQVGADAEGARMIVIGELIELSADADGRINALGSHRPTPSLVHAEDADDLGELELEAIVERRLRLSVVAGSLVGLHFDDALAALAA